MGLLDQRSEQVDQADLAIMACVETVRDQQQPATASAVAALIGGAPSREVARRLNRLLELSLLEVLENYVCQYRLSPMGAELLARDLIGWSPSTREQRERDDRMLSAVAGALRRVD